MTCIALLSAGAAGGSALIAWRQSKISLKLVHLQYLIAQMDKLEQIRLDLTIEIKSLEKHKIANEITKSLVKLHAHNHYFCNEFQQKLYDCIIQANNFSERMARERWVMSDEHQAFFDNCLNPFHIELGDKILPEKCKEIQAEIDKLRNNLKIK